MREIKFRAWIPEKKVFWAVQMIDWSTDEIHNGGNIAKLSDIVLQQYTGLIDKNGKKIYEGDIVYAKKNKSKYTVCYGEWSCEYSEDTPDDKHFGWHLLHEDNFFKEGLSDGDLLEIIGNIYENDVILEEPK